jgi:hypothetical protein
MNADDSNTVNITGTPEFMRCNCENSRFSGRIRSGGAARKVDQYAARKVIHREGGSFYVLLLENKEESACGNVGISRSVRDFQAPVEIVL